MELTLPLALAAGFISFCSPCFLPIVPAFIGQLVGTGDSHITNKRSALLNAVSFVIGFSIVFIAAWASLGAVGVALGRHAGIMRIVGGVLLVVMGLHVARLIEIPVFDRVVRAPLRAGTSGVARSGIMGIIFGAGWTPCIGPILGAIIAMAVSASTAGRGLALMVAYCLGLGVPIVLVAIGAVELSGRLQWFRHHHQVVALISGALLVVVGFLLITNTFSRLAALMPGLG